MPQSEIKNSAPEAPLEETLRSRHTPNFPQLLRDLGISLLVSTYQAGKLIILREQGNAINTHFAWMASPMGLAYDQANGRLAVGAKHDIWEFRNEPEFAANVEPKGTYDALFLPRNRHYTGDIRIHEIAWINEEIWAVNTRFSCLCTIDRDHGFVPRWKPPFITALEPEDRCHLNGLAVIDGKITYVTCLGLTDTKGGWRANKVDGGCVLDVETGEPAVKGLSMPHSPRRYAGRDWVLESGVGAISVTDLQRGTSERIGELPGFTRGLDFYGNFAFIGLSQVRETAVFSDIPLVKKETERICGVWVVDIRTGQTVAFLRFEGAVQEIFGIQVLPGIRQPELQTQAGPVLDGAYTFPKTGIK